MKNIHEHYCGVRQAFEGAINTYEESAKVQMQVAHHLIAMIHSQNISFQRVLDLGCGTGLATYQLCKKLNIHHLHISDFSKILLEKGGERLRKFRPKSLMFNFDENPWPCNDMYDLITSTMALQWSLTIESVLDQCFQFLKLRGLLAIALPLKGSFQELHDAKRLSFYTYDTLLDFLIKIGFKIHDAQQQIFNQSFATGLDAFKSIKNCGAHYYGSKKDRKISRTQLNAPLTLTYHVGFFLCQKG